METWQQPQSYAGHSPIGDYVLYSRNRDSSILENSNYELILDELTTFAEKFDHLRDDGEAFAYDFRTKHWGCGWIEYIIIRQDAPTQIIELAESIESALSDYPVYSDDDYSDSDYSTEDLEYAGAEKLDGHEGRSRSHRGGEADRDRLGARHGLALARLGRVALGDGRRRRPLHGAVVVCAHDAAAA